MKISTLEVEDRVQLVSMRMDKKEDENTFETVYTFSDPVPFPHEVTVFNEKDLRWYITWDGNWKALQKNWITPIENFPPFTHKIGVYDMGDWETHYFLLVTEKPM